MSPEPKIIYGRRGRFPIQPAKGLCRGCHAPVPPPNRAWCSRECYRKFCPQIVKEEARKRDNGICAFCGCETNHTRHPGQARPWPEKRPKANYDHIIPFCEGGLTVLENIRTLCLSCHKKRTAEWRKDRNRAKE